MKYGICPHDVAKEALRQLEGHGVRCVEVRILNGPHGALLQAQANGCVAIVTMEQDVFDSDEPWQRKHLEPAVKQAVQLLQSRHDTNRCH